MSETSFKFFIQFVVYTSIYCGFALIVTAYFTAEIRRDVSLFESADQFGCLLLTCHQTGGVNPYWIVCIALYVTAHASH